MTRLRLLGSSLVGAADQALLSAFNLAAGLAFIRFSSKPDYATYALATTALLLLTSLQNALVNSPLATLAPSAQVTRRPAIEAAGRHLQARLLRWVTATGTLAALVAWLVGRSSSALLLVACTLAALGMMSREYRRAQCFLQHDPWAALRADLVYVLLALLGLASLLWAGWLSAAAALASFGVAALLAAAVGTRPVSAAPSAAGLVDANRAIWACARWALPSVVTSWLYANAYLFLIERLLSKDAVADLSASRLLLVPLSLLVVGWSSAFRPRASQWLAAGHHDRVHRAALRSAGGFVAAGLLYGAVLWAAMPLLQAGLLGDKYGSAVHLVLPWLVFVVITSVRSVGMSSMLASAEAFQPLFRYGVIALVLALPAVLAAAWLGSVSAVPFALALAESCLLALIWWHGWPRIRAATPRS